MSRVEYSEHNNTTGLCDFEAVMIAPIRNRPTTRKLEAGAPRPIGQLLSAVLARYGIVISEAELEALSTSRPEMDSRAISLRQLTPRRSSKISSVQVRRRPLRTTASAHRKMVQLPLFATHDSVAVSFATT
jgi:hypothetical protein